MALAVALALAVAGSVVYLAGHRHTRIRSAPRPSPSLGPAPLFAFAPGPVETIPVAAGTSTQAATGAADSIRTALSGFYQSAFVDPRAWTAVPAQAWTAFAPGVRRRAQGDAASLTLGSVEGTIASFLVTDSSLKISVLLDERGQPQAAFADVSFVATAVLVGGEKLQVENRAHYYLLPVAGSWLITGYPSAHTDLRAPAPVATGSPGASPSSPTPTGTAP
jgi:hypothetical protein